MTAPVSGWRRRLQHGLWNALFAMRSRASPLGSVSRMDGSEPLPFPQRSRLISRHSTTC